MRYLPLYLLMTAVSAPALFAQSIQVQGRSIKLEPKPHQAYKRQSPEDWRTRLRSLPLPESDLKLSQSPVKDQASRGSCAYFTTIALFEQALKRFDREHRDFNLSEEYLIYANKALDKIGSRGDESYLRNNIGTMLTRGFLPEEAMPYSHSWFEKGMPCASYTDDKQAPEFCRSHFPPQAEALSQLVAPERFAFHLDSLPDLSAVIERLAAGSAVTVSVPVNQDGWQGDDGLVQHDAELEAACGVTPDLCGGHTILLTGYNLEKKEFTFKNSWGRSWGLEGYGRMPFAFLESWSYGNYFALEMERLDGELQNQTRNDELSPVQASLSAGVERDGQKGVLVSLQYDYKVPVGSFYYVSLFPMLRSITAPEELDQDATYEPIAKGDGSDGFIADRHYILSQSPSDLIYDQTRPFELFIPESELQGAGVWENPQLVFRAAIYQMSDSESYKRIYVDYLTLPPAPAPAPEPAPEVSSPAAQVEVPTGADLPKGESLPPG